jgi:tetratricopeptide (TPR) repeat protein
MIRISALALALVFVLSSATSASVGPRVVERASAPLWSELGRPGQRRARELLHQALLASRRARMELPSDWRAVCMRAFAEGDSLAMLRGRARALRELLVRAMRRRAHLEAALSRLEAARALSPRDPEIAYALGRALLSWEEPVGLQNCSVKRRDEQAIAVLSRLRREHPEFSPDSVGFDLAVLFTRSRRFAEAAAHYAAAHAVALDREDGTVTLTNLAEVTMLGGDLEGAVRHYERALSRTSGGRDYLLALWGLAVALDRLGEHARALELAGKALHAEGGQMPVLRSDGVFFEPEHELHYYESLGHEARAGAADSEKDRAGELALAAVSLRRYLAADPEGSLFGPAARANLARIERAQRQAPGQELKAPR